MDLNFVDDWKVSDDVSSFFCSSCKKMTQKLTVFCPFCGERKLNECSNWRLLSEGERYEHVLKEDINMDAKAFVVPFHFKFCPVCGGITEAHKTYLASVEADVIKAPPFSVVQRQSEAMKNGGVQL